jgi:hypothetical protein
MKQIEPNSEALKNKLFLSSGGEGGREQLLGWFSMY